jgi:hypothetical protein
MNKSSIFNRLYQVILPLIIFLFVWSIHFLWHGLFPEQDSSQWLTITSSAESSWWYQYVENQNYYIGFSYALSLAFAAVALRRYKQQQLCQARSLAIGSITLSGFFAVAGCYLLGCCGSPMLAVYLSLLGTSFLPFAKPLIAILTTIFIVSGWWWMNRFYRNKARTHSS